MRVEVHWLEPVQGSSEWKHSEARYEFKNGVQLGSEIFYLLKRGCVIALMFRDREPDAIAHIVPGVDDHG